METKKTERIWIKEQSDKDFLSWIYERLCNVHHENPDVDYMRRMKEIVDSL